MTISIVLVDRGQRAKQNTTVFSCLRIDRLRTGGAAQAHRSEMRIGMDKPTRALLTADRVQPCRSSFLDTRTAVSVFFFL